MQKPIFSLFLLQYEHTFINSHQAILFRKFLLSRDLADSFLKYLKIKAMSDTLGIGIKYPKADLDFWYEVQKYKVSNGFLVEPPIKPLIKDTLQ